MPCITCSTWLPPDKIPGDPRNRGKSVAGRCTLDGELSHPYYTCPRFSSASANVDTAGLTDDEIEWLRVNSWSPAAAHLLDLFRKIEEHPDGRVKFEVALVLWRNRRTGEKTFNLRATAPRVV